MSSPQSATSPYTIDYVGNTCVEVANGTVNDLCPPGHYCPTGSASPLQCPQGTNSTSTGLANHTDCPDCIEGYYCPNNGTILATQQCLPGYYCPAGTGALPDSLKCTLGHRCPLGSSSPVPCSSGEYQDVTGQSVCKTCPSGYYCDGSTITPTDFPCPAGYYCPNATEFSTQYACPSGTFSNDTSLEQIDQCTQCIAGHFCEGVHLAEPTGECLAGYFCGLGANVSSPHDSNLPYTIDYVGDTCVDVTNGTVNDICPPGHYCPTGSASPSQCPQGTNSTSTGLVAHTDCPDCPSGYYCPNNGTVFATQLCPPGFYCPPGTVNPLSNCTIGHYCPEGSMAPVPCDAGTYQDEVGQSECKACLEGNYCEIATVTPALTCTPHHYCPNGTASPLVCPDGTYTSNTTTGLKSVDECSECIAGYYCQDGVISGECAAGFFCKIGQGVPNPVLDLTQYSSPDAALEYLNVQDGGQCPPGHYCYRRTADPFPCENNTVRVDVMGAAPTDCGPCPAGFVCLIGNPVPVPCDKGFYCPLATSAIACPISTYNNRTSKSALEDCLPCPAGSFCNITAISNYRQFLCPRGFYCELGTREPTTCPNGTTSLAGARNVDECIECPAGYWCPETDDVFDCPIGHFCPAGQLTPLPCPNGTVRQTTLAASVEDCHICEQGHYCPSAIEKIDCPVGQFCPDGVMEPIECPAGSYRDEINGTDITSCFPCPGGHYCPEYSVTTTVCDAGTFCPPSSFNMTECTPGEYCSVNTTYPILCPIGQYCPTPPEIIDCPVGRFCPEGSIAPIDCPAGTYRDVVNGGAEPDCFRCPGGHYCEQGSNVTIGCDATTYCPIHSSNMTVCPQGNFCPANTTTPFECPASHYCPQGNAVPLVCQIGTYCPPGTPFEIPCPLGYKGVDVVNHTLSLLGALDTACEPCLPGLYGNDPERLQCDSCTPGYVCVGATTSNVPTDQFSQRGYQCPAGYYCPEGTSDEFACPVGTFRETLGAVAETNCTACPGGTYQHLEGSSSCRPCSSSSASLPNATSCTCVGKNRAFQPESGFCICQPGYEFVDQNFVVSSEEDGTFDCQPIVYDRCALPLVRSSDGGCVSPDAYCVESCGSGGGEFSSTTGTCQCNEITPVDVICDEDCRSSATTVTCGSNGTMLVTDANGVSTEVAQSDISMEGDVDCSVLDSNIYSMSTSNGSFSGYFGVGDTLTTAVARRRRLIDLEDFEEETETGTFDHDLVLRGLGGGNYSNHSFSPSLVMPRRPRKHRFSRRLASSDPVIENPVVCIRAGDSIMFDVSNEDYPVYAKDSLLNTNDEFDYTAFRNLGFTASTTISVSTFAFTFTEPGMYVFYMFSKPSSLTIISVVAAGVTCTTSAQFVEFSSANLITMGVKSNSSIVLAPDWGLVVGLLLGMLTVVLIVVGFLYYFRKKAWVSHHDVDSKYRRQNKTKADYAQSKGGFWSRGNVTVVDGRGGTITSSGGVTKKPSCWNCFDKNNKVDAAPDEDAVGAKMVAKGGADFDDVDLEQNMNDPELDFDDDMLIPELAKHIQSNHDELGHQIANQKDLLAALQKQLKLEVEDLKNLLSSSILELTTGGGPGKKLAAILKQLKIDCSQRSAFEVAEENREARMVGEMDALVKLLTSGAAAFAADVVSELSVQGEDLHAREVSVTPEALSSPLMSKLLTNLSSLQDCIQYYFIPPVGEEKLRYDGANSAFNHAVKTANVEVDPDILTALGACLSADMSTDTLTSDICSLITLFAEKTPRFTKLISEEVSTCIAGIGRNLETGNIARLESDKDGCRNKLTMYLEELVGASNMLSSKFTERCAVSKVLRDGAEQCRFDLIALIDQFLLDVQNSGAGNLDMNKLLPQLIDALRSGGSGALSSLMLPGGGDQLLPPDDPDSPRRNRMAKSKATAVAAEEAVAKEAEEVYANDALTAFQKEEMMEAKENEAKIIDAMDAIEKKKLDDAIRQAQEAMEHKEPSAVEGEADGAEVLSDEERFKQEEKMLLEKQRLEHEAKLAAELRSMSAEGSLATDADSLKEVQLSALANARYILCQRVHGAALRNKVAELKVQHEQRYADECLEVLTAVVSPRSRGDQPSSSDIVVIDEEEWNIKRNAIETKVETDMEAAAKALCEKLGVDRMLAAQKEDQLRDTWLGDISAVDLQAEIERVRTETAEQFAQLEVEQSKMFKRCTKSIESLSQLRKKEMRVRDSVSKYLLDSTSTSSSLKNKNIDGAIEAELAVKQKRLKVVIENEVRVLAAEQTMVQDILKCPDAFSLKIDYRAQQSALFQRISKGHHTYSGAQLRLAMVEQDLRNEINEVRAVNELTRCDADANAVDEVLNNLGEVANERKLLVTEKVTQKMDQLAKAEGKRQESAANDFEGERVLAIERNCLQNISMSVQLSRSKRQVLSEFIQALKEKHEVLLNALDRSNTSTAVKDLTNKQIEMETLREEFEMNAAYVSFEAGWVLGERYRAEMVEGFDPSIEYGDVILHEAFVMENHKLRDAAQMDMLRKRYKTLGNAKRVSDVEIDRLQQLGRSPHELDALWKNIQMGVEEKMRVFGVFASGELGRVEDSIRANFDEKMAVQQNYDKVVQKLRAGYKTEVESMRNAFATEKNRKLNEFRNGVSVHSEDHIAIEMHAFDQNSAAALVDLEIRYSKQLCDAFTAAMNAKSTVENVDDGIRSLRQHLQQQSEALDNTTLATGDEQYGKLMNKQNQRRSEAEALRKEYEQELLGLEGALDAKKKQSQDFLKKSLEKRKKARAKELMDLDGKSQVEAEQIAAAELSREEEFQKDKLAKQHDRSRKLQLTAANEEFQEMSEDAERSKQLAADMLAGGSNNAKFKRIKDLTALLQAKEKERIKELIAGGMDAAQAEVVANKEMKQRLKEGIAGIEASLAASGKLMKDGVSEGVKDRLDALDSAKEKACVGKSAEESAAIAAAFESEAERLRRVELAAHSALDSGLQHLKDKEHKALQERLKNRKKAVAAAVEKDSPSLSAEEVSSKVDELMLAEEAAEKAELEAVLAGVEEHAGSAVDDQYNAKILAMKQKHECTLNGLEASLQTKKDLQQQHLRDRLKKHQKHQQAVLAQVAESGALTAEEVDGVMQQEAMMGDAELDRQEAEHERDNTNAVQEKQVALEAIDASWEQQAKELAALEDKESTQLRSEQAQKENDLIKSDEAANSKIISSAMQAAKAVRESANDSLANIREEHEKAVEKLQVDMYNKKQQAEKRLNDKIVAARNKAKQKIKTAKEEVGDIIDDSVAEQLAVKEVAKEEATAWEQLNQELNEEEKRKSEELADALQAEEAKIMEVQHVAAAEKAAKSAEETEDANAKLIALKHEQDEEVHKLEDKLAAKRKAQEERLKAKLAEKKAANAMKMAAEHASDETQRQEQEKLAQEAHAELVRLQKEQMEEEEAERKRLQAEQEKLLIAAQAEAKQKETEAAIAALEETTLSTIKDIKARNEEELRNREVQRMREAHDRETEKAAKAEAAQRSAGKEKLAERIAAKRAKKEAELKAAEEKALQELTAKHEEEKREAEALKEAKKVWTDRLADAQQEAKKSELEGAAEEDFLLGETLGKKLVPETHMTECVELILKERHSGALTQLLTVQYGERVSAIKTAIEKISEEKKQAKLDLYARLAESRGDEEDDATFSRTAVQALDEEYVQKQHQAEMKATAVMESAHMKAQMALRQEQLSELASIISMYSDSDSLSKLQALNGKSQIQEMADYRERLERERKEREEKMELERHEQEDKLRKQHEAGLLKMEEELRVQKEKTEAAMDVKRQAIERQKEEAEKKALDEAGTMNKQEKDKILAEHEAHAKKQLAALETERKDQKSKLNERLAARRSKNPKPAAVPAPASEAPTTADPAAVAAKPAAAKPVAQAVAPASDSGAAIAAASEMKVHMSKIETKLERIDRVLATLESGVGFPAAAAAAAADAPAPTPVPAAAAAPTYRDTEEPAEGTGLEVMEDEDCSLQMIARLDFGRNIAADKLGLKSLTIKAAKSLAPSTLSNNAFKSSYFYDVGSNTLYVHQKKLTSSGDFGLIVIHALSHIAVNPKDLSNDGDLLYIAEFYKNLKILSQDLYKKSSSEVSAGPKKSAASSAVKKGGREDKDKDYFTPDSIRERLKLYTSEANHGSGYAQASVPGSFFDRYSQEKTSESSRHPVAPSARSPTRMEPSSSIGTLHEVKHSETE